MTLSVLITRPLPEAEDYAAELQGQGFETYLAPMLEIVPLPFDVLDDFDALIFTSAEGVRAYCDGGGVVKGQAICVGKYTAHAARDAGFEAVVNVAGTGRDVVDYIGKSNLNYLHIGGKHVAYPIAEKLRAFGTNCTHVPVYEAQKVSDISPDILDAIREKRIDVVTFYSKRTAEAFLDLAAQSGVVEALNTIKCLSISDAVLECVRLYNYEWNGLYVSSTPDRTGMLEQLKSI